MVVEGITRDVSEEEESDSESDSDEVDEESEEDDSESEHALEEDVVSLEELHSSGMPFGVSGFGAGVCTESMLLRSTDFLRFCRGWMTGWLLRYDDDQSEAGYFTVFHSLSFHLCA